MFGGAERGCPKRGSTRKGLSTDLGCAGGPVRSSGEVPAGRGGGGAKGPGHLWRCSWVNRERVWEELHGQAEVSREVVRDLQVGGLGGVSASEGQQGCTGCGQGDDGRLRDRSAGESLPHLEPHVGR